MNQPHIYRIEAGGKWGFIDDQGRLTVSVEYNDAGIYRDDFVVPVLKGRRLGLLDNYGDVVRPCDIPYVRWFCWFSDGLLAVQNKKGKWGYINTEGETVIEAQYDGATEFRCGLGIVRKKTKYLYLNRQGEVVISPQNPMDVFACDRSRICSLKDIYAPSARFGYIDALGKFVIPCIYYDANHYFSGNRSAVSDQMFPDKRGRPKLWYKLIDINGDPVTGPEYRHINKFYYSRASYVREEGGRTVYGVLTLDGTRIMESPDMRFYDCTDRVIDFCRNHEDENCRERHGLMDAQGNILFESKRPCQFSEFKNGFCVGLLGDGDDPGNDFFEYFTEDGRQITDGHFSYADGFEHAMGYARINEERHVYVNREGRVFHWDDYK